MKSKSKKITKAIAMALAVATLIGTNSASVYAWNEVSTTSEYGTKIEESTSKVADFTIDVRNKGDEIEVYKLADMKWENGTFVGPTWDSMLQGKINADSYYSQFASTPLELGAADSSKQAEFLQWLYTNRNTNNVSKRQVASTSITTLNDGMRYKITGAAYGIYLVHAVNTELKKDYQLLTVDVLPTQEGPGDNWYIKSDINATLKFSDVDVEKTIDGKYGEVVVTDQEVQFDIYAEVPGYPGVDVVGEDGNKTKSYEGYPFSIVDTMSSAFKFLGDASQVEVLYSTTPYKNEDGSMKDGVSWEPLDTEDYDIVFADAATSASGEGIHTYFDDSSNSYIYCYAKKNEAGYTLDWWAYNDSESGIVVATKLDSTTDTSVPDAFKKTSVMEAYKELTGIETTQFKRNAVAAYKPFRAISFNYDKVRETNAKFVKVTYNATVTAAMTVGTDDNKNNAKLYYQYDVAGSVKSKEDEAYAWTYALNLVKVDGDTSSSNYTPLAGAEFNIYKEAFTYVQKTETVDESVSVVTADPSKATDYDKFVWIASFDKSEAAPIGNIATGDDAATDVSLANLKLLAESTEYGDAYHRIVSFAETEDCGIEECKANGQAHSHVIVYPYYEYNVVDPTTKTVTGTSHQIVSVADLKGVTIEGLEPASYVLIETKEPTGYNKLKEALRFEIVEMTEAQAKAIVNAQNTSTPMGDGSLKGFMSDEEYTPDEIAADTKKELVYVNIGTEADPIYMRVYDTGTYKITVKNYKGITLPSTGGMGTLLFTLIGVMVMAMAMVIVVVRRRGERY